MGKKAQYPSFRLRLVYALTAVSLLWERFWEAFFAPVGVFALFCALSFFNLHTAIGKWGHVLELLIFFGAFLYTMNDALKRFKMPKHGDFRRRIETSSHMEHRPLEALEDKPSVALDEDGEKLWEFHKILARRAVTGLRPYRPAPKVAERDPYGMRLAVAVLLVCGFIVAGDAAGDRFANAFRPQLLGFEARKAAVLDLWITPPEYTQKAPIFLASAQEGKIMGDKTVYVPQHSVITARVSGREDLPVLRLAENDITSFEKVTSDNFVLEKTVTQAKEITVKQDGKTLGSWQVDIERDNEPSIYFTGEPEATEDSALQVSY